MFLNGKGYCFSISEEQWFELFYLRQRNLEEASISGLTKLWNPPFPQKVLEVGCGSGRFLCWLYERGHVVYGVEPSKELIEKSKKRLPPHIEIRNAKAEQLPFENGIFDVVFFVFSLEYVDDPKKALAEAFRVSKGSVIAILFNKLCLHLWLDRISGIINQSPLGRGRILGRRDVQRLVNSVFRFPVFVRWITCGGKNPFLAPLLIIRFDMASGILVMKKDGFSVKPAIASNVIIRTRQEGFLYERSFAFQKDGKK